ncbi:ABC transporter permease [Pseudaminobacter sp. 19-2017]|uniref:ABC transporter permease n=1 Tax=Pseudaminobacter soli (ex Zhang et al. 2022) TaxID=2831468 RepID=A0A942E706_9HYPH|nr:ABC transporter permease [Pseudaminobacter soli]MBS3652495.1 ABC transporter permease [Pseudaminobacter soli]
MLVFALKRFVVGILVMLAVSTITFTLTNVAADPARTIAGEGASAADVEAIREAYGFDRPIIVRYGEWLGGALRADLGDSYRQRRPVVDVVMERLPVTMSLGGLAFAIAILAAIPLGIIAGLRPNSWIDRASLTFALIGQAMPTFWFALLGIVVFSVTLKWLPVSGSSSLSHFVLPAVVLAYYATPTLMRLTRAGMIEVMQSDYIRTAKAKGLRTGKIVLKHALRNAILPLVSVAAVQFGFMLGGSVVVETIFAMRGVGYLAWESITYSDLPVVQAIVLTIAAIYVVLTLAADIMNAWLDPRLRSN